MPVSKAQQKAVAKYMKENYDEIKVRTSKGKKEVIKETAESIGMTLNGFVNAAIDEKIQRCNSSIHAPTKENLTEPNPPPQPIEVKSAETMSDEEFLEQIKALKAKSKTDGEARGGEQEDGNADT